ncbi:MAG: hypothetical protein JJ863_03885 [Deltaproteobacteria bacterium]|nr:hypothetical protein [Deltaproteobacteria bacterium]
MFLALLALLSGCEDGRSPEEPPEPEAAPLPELPEEPTPSPWPTEVRSLEESVADFESLDGCVASMRESVPVEVAELLSDLGYDAALSEVCRSLQAAATGDPSHCDALVSSAVRRRCRTRVATLHQKPEACPDALGTEGGRDPSCLAWALRDAALCDGAGSAERSTCLAVATGDAERCAAPLGLTSEAGCRAMVTRMEGLVDADAPRRRDPPELAIDESDPELALPAHAARTLERGVVAVAVGCSHRVSLRVAPGLGDTRDHVGLTLDLRISRDGGSLGPGSEVAIGAVGTSHALHGELTLADGTEAVPGGRLEAIFETTYTRDGAEHTLSGHLRTFFRDAAPLPESCALPQ